VTAIREKFTHISHEKKIDIRTWSYEAFCYIQISYSRWEGHRLFRHCELKVLIGREWAFQIRTEEAMLELGATCLAGLCKRGCHTVQAQDFFRPYATAEPPD
jgi:hypothetical protein